MDKTSAQHPLHTRRRAGILLHPTSLPGPAPRGLMGHDAYRFIEFLHQAGIGVWQMLPLGPTHADGSPYQALSAHACDSSLISLDWLKDRGLLDEIEPHYDMAYHTQSLQQAHARFMEQKPANLYAEYQQFGQQHAYWLGDYALFMALREAHKNRPWTTWEMPLRLRQEQALRKAQQKYADAVSFHQFTQFVAFQQWHQLREYANKLDILMFGDLPIYVSLDSADVWANPELFMLDHSGQATFVAGVPPDYFSDTGQRWGNPQYDWQAMQAQDFSWWQARFETQLELFDLLRVDHFRGFQAYWEIPATEETAINGRWVEAPGKALLEKLHTAFENLPLVAEDLGIITDKVHALRQAFNLPGMKILQFAFDGNPHNSYLPHNHQFNSVVYTGTHDNDTSLSWYQHSSPETHQYIQDYLNHPPADPMPWPLIRAAFASVSCLAVCPMQDILGLGIGERMNTPGTTEGNWQWRFSWEQLNEGLDQRLRQMLRLYDRAVNK